MSKQIRKLFWVLFISYISLSTVGAQSRSQTVTLRQQSFYVGYGGGAEKSMERIYSPYADMTVTVNDSGVYTNVDFRFPTITQPSGISYFQLSSPTMLNPNKFMFNCTYINYQGDVLTGVATLESVPNPSNPSISRTYLKGKVGEMTFTIILLPLS